MDRIAKKYIFHFALFRKFVESNKSLIIYKYCFLDIPLAQKGILISKISDFNRGKHYERHEW